MSIYSPLLLCIATFGALFGEIPIFHEERLIPFSTLGRSLQEEDLVIPSRTSPSWISIKALRKSPEYNFTYFADEDLQTILKNPTALSVENGYEQLASPIEGIPSQFTLQLEALYQKIPFTKILLAIFALSLFWPTFFRIGTVMVTLFLLTRILILGRPPVSNMEESLLFAGWIAATLLSLFGKRRELLLAGSLFIGTLLTTLLPYPDPLPLYTVPPVLNSNFWLTIHVLLIVSSYGILIPIGVLAHILLIRKMDYLFPFLLNGLYAGTITLISGTLLGGVWAGLSWGRFWGWDPKESWAFISSLLYLAVIHGYRMGIFGSFETKIGAIIGMISLSFTWYGVNYVLATGLHSYGFGSGSHLLYFSFLFVEMLFLSFILLTRDLKTAKK